MTGFETKWLPERPDVLAPDGSAVRILLRLSGGSMAHFELPAGQVSKAVTHRTVEEIWYVLEGEGEVWRQAADGEAQTVRVTPGTALTIPLGCRFQFRCTGDGALRFLCVTTPPWPGEQEAIVEAEAGAWQAPGEGTPNGNDNGPRRAPS